MHETRKNEILRYINENEAVSVKKLCQVFYVSEATIRRDLKELSDAGQINRIFGGATIALSGEKQIPLYVRERENKKAKQEIALLALKHIKDGSTIFLDGSSTVLELARLLHKKKDIIVITNGLRTAEVLAAMNIKTYVTGGLLINNSLTFIGRDAESFLEKYNASIAFLSCKGMKGGKFTDTSERETVVRRKMMENADKTILLMTSNKKGKTYLHTLCTKEEISEVICDP